MLEKEHKPYGLSPLHPSADKVLRDFNPPKHKGVIVLIFIHLFNAFCLECLFFSLPKGKLSLKKLD